MLFKAVRVSNESMPELLCVENITCQRAARCRGAVPNREKIEPNVR